MNIASGASLSPAKPEQAALRNLDGRPFLRQRAVVFLPVLFIPAFH